MIMSSIKEFRGVWYSPKKEDVKLPGVLTINQKENEIKLVLFSENDIAGETIIGRDDKIINYCKIILGLTNKGDHITLYEHTGYEGGAPMLEYHMGKGLYESTYRPNFAFVGKHFTTPESILFNNYAFRYNFLDSWIDTTRSYFNRKREKNGDLTITVPTIPDIEVQIEEDCKLHIIRDTYSKGDYSSKYELEVRHYVKFDFTSPVSIHKYLNLSAKFRAFLTFAVGYPISTIDEFAETDNMDRWHEQGSLEIYHSHSEQNIDNRKLFQHHMFFCSQNIKHEDLIMFLSNWFNIYDTYHSAIDIFLHAVSPFWKKGNTTVSNVQFTNGLLNICQAIETFYNRDNDVNYLEQKKELNNLKQKGYDKILKNKETLNFTDSELNYYKKYFRVPKSANEVDYKNKIIHYLNELKQALKCFINEDGVEKFASDLKNYRNTITHVNHDGDFDEKYDLPYLFYHSQILFYAMIMNQIGMPQTKINDLMKNSDKFRNYNKSTNN